MGASQDRRTHPLRTALAAVGMIGVATSFVACPTNTVTLVAPEDPVAVITLHSTDVPNIQFGESIDLSGEDSILGDGTDGLGLELSWFWSIDSQPVDSLLVDESLQAPDALGDDDDSAGSGEPSAPTGENSIVRLIPDVQGLYGITLQVSDGERVSDFTHMVIQVGGGNSCPTADAGVDLVAQTGVPVTLDGSGSTDEDVTSEGDDDDDETEGQTLTWSWHLSLTPSDSLLEDGDIFYQGTEHPVIIPDVAGTYILQLRVEDGLCTSLPDYVTVQASDGNQPPVADAGQSQILTPCAPTEVNLDGSASFDPEGSVLDFEWHFTSVPNGSDVSDAFLDGQYTVAPAFNWDVPGIYTLELRVDDGQGQSEPDYVAVQAVPSLPNGAPEAFAGEDVLIEASAACSSDPYGGGSCNPCGTRSVVLDGTGSYDPDGDPLNFQWDLQSGAAEILGIESSTLEVDLPQQSVSYGGTSTATVTMALTVFDCRAADDDTLTITYICNGF
ncbi:MAG: hypothetical protein GY898_22930 [Proteobacteria bacterium]|nr:hypothetical protein [Pseudomonadota bacterium]